MRYSKTTLIRRLQESEKEFLTEKELPTPVTPYINNIEQVVESVENAGDKGYSGDYTINYISGITGISRQTFYRLEDEGMIQRKDNMLNICELYRILLLIKTET